MIQAGKEDWANRIAREEISHEQLDYFYFTANSIQVRGYSEKLCPFYLLVSERVNNLLPTSLTVYFLSCLTQLFFIYDCGHYSEEFLHFLVSICDHDDFITTNNSIKTVVKIFQYYLSMCTESLPKYPQIFNILLFQVFVTNEATIQGLSPDTRGRRRL